MSYTDKERYESAEAILKVIHDGDQANGTTNLSKNLKSHFAKFTKPEDPDKELREMFNKFLEYMHPNTPLKYETLFDKAIELNLLATASVLQAERVKALDIVIAIMNRKEGWGISDIEDLREDYIDGKHIPTEPEKPSDDMELRQLWKNLYSDLIPQDVGEFSSIWNNYFDEFKDDFKDYLISSSAIQAAESRGSVKALGEALENLKSRMGATYTDRKLQHFEFFNAWLKELRTQYTKGGV